MHNANTCEPFPARTPSIRFLDRIMFIVAFIGPVALLPQVFQIYEQKSVAGLSLYTWGALTVVNALWAFYGFVHKDKPILIANLIVALLDVAVVAGILIYTT